MKETLFILEISVPKRKPPPNDDQLELFSAIFTDIASRDTHDTLEHPFLSLSKKPRFKPIRYTGPNGVEVTVSAGEPHGIANIFDWDLIIFLLSQIRHAADQGMQVSRKVRFSRWAYLKDVRRHTSGDEYQRLESAIARLKHTTVTTTIRAKKRRTIMFNWIEYVDIDRDDAGRLQDVTVVIPEWLFDAVYNYRLVLTLHRDYFLLKGGLERWLYRIIRKGAGTSSWKWSLRSLFERSGSSQSYKYFARDLRKLVARKTLLDYRLSIVAKNGKQYLTAEKNKSLTHIKQETNCQSDGVHFLKLNTETYVAAKVVASGHDIYAIEQIWRRYSQKMQTDIKHPDKAFIAFCKTYAAKNPIPKR